MTVLLNSAYHHRTHLVDITVMHCVNSNINIPKFG